MEKKICEICGNDNFEKKSDAYICTVCGKSYPIRTIDRLIEDNKATTKEFNIFGAKVMACKSLKEYQNTIDYYKAQKSKFADQYIRDLPKVPRGNTKIHLNRAWENLSGEAVRRLNNKGIVTTADDLVNFYMGEGADYLIAVNNTIVQVYKTVLDATISDMWAYTQNNINTIRENVTGLSYGVIGGPLDLFLYDIDNILEKRRQYRRIQPQLNRYDDDMDALKRQADQVLADAYKKAEPVIRDMAEKLMDDIARAEAKLCIEKGIWDKKCIDDYDPKLSDEIAERISKDYEINVGLSLQHNPYNAKAYRKAFQKGLVSSDLVNMIKFLNIYDGVDVNSYVSGTVNESNDFNDFANKVIMVSDIAHIAQGTVLASCAKKSTELVDRIKNDILISNLDPEISSITYAEQEFNKRVSKELLDKVRQVFEKRRVYEGVQEYGEIIHGLAKERDDAISLLSPTKNYRYSSYAEYKKDLDYYTIKKSAEAATSEKDYSAILNKLKVYAGYRDCDDFKQEIEQCRNEIIYKEALASIEETLSLNELNSLLVRLNAIKDYKDTQDLITKCTSLINAEKHSLYDEAKSLYSECTEASISRAIELMKQISPYLDSEDLMDAFDKGLAKERKYLAILQCADSTNIASLNNLIEKLSDLGDYKDSEKVLTELKNRVQIRKQEDYNNALSLVEVSTEASLKEAISLLESIKPYKDSDELLDKCNKRLPLEKDYVYATSIINENSADSLQTAMLIFESLEGYKDSSKKRDKCQEVLDNIVKQYHEKVQELLSSIDHQVLDELEGIYNKLEKTDYDDNRRAAYKRKLESISDLRELYVEWNWLNKEHEKLGGLFKKKQRLEVEAKMQMAKDNIKKLWETLK